jgi:thioredoxin reductase (NADPH)
MITTDIIVVGAGPVGLFAVFEAGLLQMRCHLIDVLPHTGGQLTELYPRKPIYDIPGHPAILAEDLIANLMEQMAPFKPGMTLGERAEQLEKRPDGTFCVTTHLGTQIQAPVVALAAGMGSFEPRKPRIEGLQPFEERSILYQVTDPEQFRNKRVVIAGGGDSALDWCMQLADVAAELTLVHRRVGFRGAPDSAEKVKQLAEAGRIRLLTSTQVVDVQGEDDQIRKVKTFHKANGEEWLPADYFLPLFGYCPQLGPILDWGLNIEDGQVVVHPEDYQTHIPGLFAVGDISTYPGKLKLILCGFHEATHMAHAASPIVHPGKAAKAGYTSVHGVKGFD